ncbi:MAG: GntR family transcriptional regulator [Tissierellaceae bacterium]
MNFNNNLPIYIQIMDHIKKQIASGELKGGDKLDSVRELSTKLKVNPNTIQRTYQELEREELVFTQRGMGTFVTEDEEMILKIRKDMASSLVNTFIREMQDLGYGLDDIIEIINERLRGD